MTHCDVITLLFDCIPLEVSLQFRFCTCSSIILQYCSTDVKTIAKLELRNPLSVYCGSFLEITHLCVQVNINECHILIVKSCYYSIIDSIILKYGSNVVKTVAKVELRHPLSVYCDSF